MKKLLAAALLTLSVSFSARAISTVILYPNCHFTPTMGECSLSNTIGRPVSCNFQVRGQSRRGAVPSSYQYVILYPGMYSWGRVVTNNPADPIINVGATAFCNTID